MLLPSTPASGPTKDFDEARAVQLELIIAELAARKASGRIGYWAAFQDERGLSHYAITTDPSYADLSPENAVSRTQAVVGFDRAIERYRASWPISALARESRQPVRRMTAR